MDEIDAGPRGLCGWEEVFTDFDSWICKFNRHLNRRSSRVIQSVGFRDSQIQNATRDANADEEKEKELGSLTLQHLLTEGFTIENVSRSNRKVHIVKNLGNFLNIFQVGDEFAGCDYLMIKLLSGGKVITEMMSETKEWCIKAPWGNIACVSWGVPQNRPVLMVHGYMDSAATFIPIVKHLPDDYFYLAVDLPGHGKSDPFPVGMLISQAHQIEAVRRAVEHFKWDKFVYFTHSVGFAIGVLYNFLYPFEIVKMVNLDPVPPLSTYCFHEYSPMLYYQYNYDDYYDNYPRWELHRNKQYTYDQAIQLLVRSRKLTKEQSAVVLSRTLIPLANGMFKLSWEPTMKKVVGITVTEDTLSSIVTTNAPPMLNIVASIDETIKPLRKNGIRLMNRFQESIPNFFVHNVIGTHDVHIKNPESFVDKIIDFLNNDFTSSLKAKL